VWTLEFCLHNHVDRAMPRNKIISSARAEYVITVAAKPKLILKER